MELDAKAKARIASLNEEMDAIHFANKLYWQYKNPTLAAKAEYLFRTERLDAIRAELDQLRSGPCI
jgi:hypothetical protein